MTDHSVEQEPSVEIVQEEQDSRPGTGLALPEETLPDKLYLLPATNRPFFPAQVQPVLFNREPWSDTLGRVSHTDHKTLGICYLEGFDHQQAASATDLSAHFPEIGCAVKVHKLVQEDHHLQFIAAGMRRFRILHWIRREPPYLVQVQYLPTPTSAHSDEVKAYAMALIDCIKELLPLNPLYNEELKHYLNRFSPNDPAPLADFAAAITSAAGPELQEVLETLPLLARMEKVLVLIRKELDIARLQAEITQEVNQKISQHQREFFLKEQLKVIQKELGLSKDDRTADADEFRARLEEREVPPAALKKIEEELKKLAILETGSPEYAVTRNYLDWATALPWGLYSDDRLDLCAARRILDRDHEGLADVKERILEFLAVGAYKGELAGSIMLLVGPPGVGKTSIGKSVADALGRKFYRLSLGGMRDEAEIKGHRRTYIGALPGKLVQALKEVEVANPVIMLDEIDKIGASFHGDPASALLEVLDPEQNVEFLDHYLDMRVDLSKVLFICTANQLDSIPGPLLDRMDTIRLSGYLAEEKLEIARKHLWPRQLERAGLKKAQVKLTPPALKQLIEGYAREAGVRQLDKLLNRLVRKAVVKLLGSQTQVRIGLKELPDYLGQPLFRPDAQLKGVGVITGLAWTSMGGATLPVEAAAIASERAGFKQTGQLGDVMTESSEIAYSFVRAEAKALGIDPSFFDSHLIHLHVPEGATPKDGPSAGITMASALLSLARGKAPRSPLAMTGELTLTGQVLAVGGIREKLIAAKRIGITEVILPEACRRDYLELPDYVRSGLEVHFVSQFKDVARLLFAA